MKKFVLSQGAAFLLLRGLSAPFPRCEAAPAGGIYRLDSRLGFNVLEAASFDPASGRITLVGRQDPAFSGPPIPYLAHLAELIDHSSPAFTLAWTAESQPRVEAMFRDFDSPAYVQALASRWAQVMDANGRAAGPGKWILPYIQIKATPNGNRLGYLGAAVREADGILEIVSVDPNSPAARAGLSPGDGIYNFGNADDFNHFVKLIGEGGTLMLQIKRGGTVGPPTNIILDGAPGDPWAELDKFDLVERMLWASGNQKGAMLVNAYGRLTRLMYGTRAGFPTAFNMVIAMSDDNDTYWREVAQYNAGHLSQDELLAHAFRAMLAALERAFDITDQSVTAAFDRARSGGSDSGSSYDQAIPVLNERMKSYLEQTMKSLLAKNEEIVVPAEVMEQTLGRRVEVRPQFEGIEPTSALAKVFFSADYLGKSLINQPALRARIPRYESEFMFEREHPGQVGGWRDTGQNRLWFSIGRLACEQSPDGNTLRTRSATIQINIRQIGPDGRDAPPIPNGYDALLTSLYPEFERQFPVLHELREAAKLAGVAAWLEEKRPGLHLPKAGRASWTPPRTAPGVLFMTFSPKERPGRLAAALSAMGGIIWEVRRLEPGPTGYPTAESVERVREAIRQALVHWDEDELAEKLTARIGPPPAGLTAPAPLGCTSAVILDGQPARAVTVATRPDLRDAPAPTLVRRDSRGGGEELWDQTALDRQIAFLTVSLSQASTPRDQATLLLLLGQALHDKGDDANAVKVVKEAMKLDPANPALKLLAAKQEFDEGDVAAAKADLQAYVAAVPGNQAASRLLAGLQSAPGARPAAAPSGPIPAAPGTLEPFKPALDFQYAQGQLSGQEEEAAAAARELPNIPAPHLQLRPLPPPPSVPPALTENWRRYQTARTALEEQYRAINTQIEGIRGRAGGSEVKASGAPDEESLRRQQAEIRKKEEEADKRMENDIIQWNEEKPAKMPLSQ